MKHVKTIISSLSPLITVVMLFCIMEAAVRVFKIPYYVLPSPFLSLKYIITDFNQMSPHLFKTFKEYFIGYPIGSAIGILLALLFTISRLVNKAVSPYLTILYCTPMLVLVPLLKIWLGVTAAVSVVVCALSCFGATLTQTITGAVSIPLERIELIQTCKGSKLQQFFFITIPSVWPSIFTGLKLGSISGLAGVIAAEMIGDKEGIGFMIRLCSYVYQMKEMFAYAYVLMAFGFLIYTIISSLEGRLIRSE